MKQQKIKKILSKKDKPLFGNNRSFSNRATRRTFGVNKQKFRIGSKTYFIPVKLFHTYWRKLKQGL